MFALVYLSLSYIWNQIKITLKKLFFINNLYLFFLIFLKIKVCINNNVLIKIYDFYIFIIYHLFFFVNIDEAFNFIKALNLNIFNLLKYIKDPILNRNINFT